MSIWEGIGRTVSRQEKGAPPNGVAPLIPEDTACYLGVPCTASVTTARVSEGASISRKV